MAGNPDQPRLWRPHPTPRWEPAERVWLVEQGLLGDGLVREEAAKRAAAATLAPPPAGRRCALAGPPEQAAGGSA
jgi:hypothetical protein